MQLSPDNLLKHFVAELQCHSKTVTNHCSNLLLLPLFVGQHTSTLSPRTPGIHRDNDTYSETSSEDTK